MYVSITFVISFPITFFVIWLIIPRLKNKGITGADINKSGHPEISEMGGLAIVFGFCIGAFSAIQELPSCNGVD